MISVVEVIQSEGFEYSKALAWSAGRAVSKAWRKETGQAPDYAMKPKTLGVTGGGPAHMKAVYPEAWRPRIREIVAGYATTEPEPEDVEPSRPAINQAVALAAWGREALTGNVQRLVWEVDLEGDVGQPDAVGDPEGYNDRRWTEALDRLKTAIRGMQGNPEATTELVLIVACLGKVGATEPQPHRVTLAIPQTVDIGIAAQRPPYGKWTLCGEFEIRQQTRDEEGLPSSYFIDGIPF